MKSQALISPATRVFDQRPTLSGLDASQWLRQGLGLVPAILPALVIPLVIIWAIEAGLGHLVAAALWGVSLIFIASAVELAGRTGAWLAVTGLVIAVFAIAGSYLAQEFAVAAGLVLGAWMTSVMLAGSGGGRGRQQVPGFNPERWIPQGN